MGSKLKKNLVICVVGDKSLHKKWRKSPNRGFDLMLVYYGREKNKYKKDADYYVQTSGMFKLENIAFAVDQYHEHIKNYDAVFLPDDDMSIGATSIKRLFNIFYKYDLDLASPTTHAGFCPHDIEKTVPGLILRYCTFISMGCPIFKTQVLFEMLPFFRLNRSGWGIDYLWSEKCKNRKMAMIDSVSLEHRKSACYGPYYEALKSQGSDVDREFKILVEQYKLDTKVETFRCVHAKHLSIRHLMVACRNCLRLFKRLILGLLRRIGFNC